jgi:hypothetical protein
LEDRRGETEKRVAEIGSGTEDAGTGKYDEIIERRREAMEIEIRVDQLESDLA